MIYSIGRYKFKHGKKRGKAKLCPLSLDEIKDKDYVPTLPNGKILVKKPDYALLQVTQSEPVVERIKRYTKTRKDTSRSFIILYVGNIAVGYKSKNNMRFLPFFSKRNYMKILEEYVPRKYRVKNKDYRRVRI